MSSTFTVYKASAGSGKTFTLAVQYIKLLITTHPQEYRHTLAVTFTNKATAEMKERILEQLYGIAQGLKSSEGYLDALEKSFENEGKKASREGYKEASREGYKEASREGGKEASGDGVSRPSRKEIRERCGWALHEILHDYSRFRVETIDAFFQSVLRNLAHELGLSAKMQVDLNDREVLSQAVDNMVDDLGRKDGDVLPWIDGYIKERIESGERWDVREDIKSFAKCIFREDYMKRDEEMRKRLTSSEHIKAYKKDLQDFDRKTLAALQQAVEDTEQALAGIGIDFQNDVSYGNDYISFINKARNFRETLSKPAKDDYFWTNRLNNTSQNATTFIKKARQKDSALMLAAPQAIARLTDLNEMAHVAMRQHLAIRLALKHLNPLRLLNHIDQEVTEITSEANRFILAKTPILLSRLIQGSDAPFVFEKMGTLFHNVMIDEFQDTSRLQWQNFKVLMLENQSQGGHDLLVGDIKQSIYRWRNGDWNILANIRKEMASHNPQVESLSTNFRSARNIIDFNNHFFVKAAALIDQDNELPDTVKKIYDDVRQECKKKDQAGWVSVTVYDSDNKEDEQQMLDDLCEQVAQLHADGVPYEEMCILQRDRTKVDALIEHFRLHMPGVALVSDEAFKLGSSKTINLLICALRYLAVGEKDPVSVRLLVQRYLIDIQGHEPNDLAFATCRSEDVLPADFLERRDALATYPLSELCEELYRTLQLNRIAGEDSYLLSFYDELAAYLQNAPGDITSLLEFWENEMKEKAIPACQVNGISIVTIHKSKGLQYHTVLMPYCNFSFEKFKADDLLWCKPTAAPFNQMDVLPIQPGTQMRNSLFANEMSTEVLQKNIEELNALYVAFTRAEHNLLVWCKAAKGSNAGNLISRTLSAITSPQGQEKWQEEMVVEEADGRTIYTLGEPHYEQREKAREEDNRMHPAVEQQPIRMCSYNRRHDFKQSTEGMLFIEELDEEVDMAALRTADGLTYAQQGSLLHEIFSKITSAEQVEEVVQQYVDNGVLTNSKQAERITRLIRRAINNRLARHWFDNTYEVRNECEIAFVSPATKKAEVLRPDRVMMNDEEIIVVDFKFGKPHPEEYSEQVRNYMQLLQQMYPKHRLSGYLWYVYRNEIISIEYGREVS